MQMTVRALLMIIGAAHILTFILTFFAPEWFFANVGRFPPYNAHFLADIGAFNAPLGVGLLIAARDPQRYRLAIGLAALGNLLHTISHLRDIRFHLPPSMDLAAGIAQFVVISAPGLVLLLIFLSVSDLKIQRLPRAGRRNPQE